MSRKYPPLGALRSFEVTSRLLSFTRAAEELNVTPAAVSHRIKTLEERLGTTLFHRDNNKLHLTGKGKDYIPEVREALELIAKATERIGGKEDAHTVNLSVLPTFAVRWLVPRLAQHRKSNPNIDLRLSSTYRAVDFAKDGFDAAIRYGHGRWPGLHATCLFHEVLVPVCSPELLPGPHPVRSPEDLAGATLLHSETCPDNWSLWLKAAGATHVDPQGGPIFDSCLLTLQAAEDGLGFAAANREYVTRHLTTGRLVAPFECTVEKDMGWHFVCPEETAHQAKISALENWFLDQVGDAAALPA